MASEWKYRGRIFNLADIESIRQLIAANPEASRWALSRKLCEAWNWKQANGALRDKAQRSEEHTSELQSPCNLVCRLLLEKKKKDVRVLRRAASTADLRSGRRVD